MAGAQLSVPLWVVGHALCSISAGLLAPERGEQPTPASGKGCKGLGLFLQPWASQGVYLSQD